MPSWEGAIYYLVDRSNVILDAGDGWDAAAQQAEGGERTVREHIVGRPLESFMVGDATKMFVRACLERARLQKSPRVLTYRCDSTEDHRTFEMIVTPLEHGRVRVEHVLAEAQPRARRGTQRHGARVRDRAPQGLGWRCSQCLKVRRVGQDDWHEIPLEPRAMLAKDVCPPCAERLFADEPQD